MENQLIPHLGLPLRYKGCRFDMRFIAIAAATAFVFLSATQVQAQSSKSSSDTYKQLELFGTVLDRIRSDYVEEVSDAELIKAAIDGMLTSLDPHSSYLDEEDRKRLDVDTRGEFGGLGIEVTMEGGYVKVVSPIDDTPAAEAGMQPNDLIIALDGKSVRGMALGDAVKLMRGKVGDKIKLTVRRGEQAPFDVEIVRAVIKVSPIRARSEGKIGYIRISSFTRQTEPNLIKAVDELKKEIGEDIEGFVLDLRNNPGGLLDQAISVSDAFLDKGEIVSTRGREKQKAQRYNAQSGDIIDGLPLVILINGGSASASEIVAGALHDHGRAILVGERTFGKGSVQTIQRIPGHGAIRLTIARYYTPSGISIQAKGIEPDINVPLAKVEALDTSMRRREADLDGALDSSEEKTLDKVPLTREQKEAKAAAQDYQLIRALDVLRGISFYRQSIMSK
jgi:carboxyl-terminal processing protease